MREWEDVHDQLRSMLDEIDLRVARPVRGAGRGGLPSIGVPAPAARDAQAKSEAVHRAVLAGLLCNIGAKMETDDAQPGEYQGGRAVRFFLFPGSGLFRTRPPWVMSAEIVRTTKVYARTVAPIKPEWVEEIGAHLLRRSYSDPRWDRHAGRAVASERVTIFGLELVARRKTDYTKIDPALSRELFLTHALAAGEINGRFPFLAHNAGLREQAAEFERRTRKNNLVADDHRLAAYFKPRVPADICRAAEFERWFFAQKTAKTGLLCMSPADVLAEGARLPGPQEFPDNIDAGSLALPLAYKLDPSAEDDGITARVPIEALGQLSPEVFHWLVPGHVREKTEAILRGLGKEFRRVLPPAGQVAETILAEMPLGKRSYFDVLRERVRGATGVDVPRDVLAGVALPAWMTMRFEVVEHDAKGERVLAAGRDLGQLRALLAPKIRKGLLTSPGRFTREKILSWDFGDLPERVELERGGVLVAAFPGIADDRASVSLKLFNTFDASQIATRAGTRRLFMFEAKEALRRHTAYIPGQERMVLQFADIGPPEHFRDALLCLVADRAFIGDMLPVRTEKEFAFRVSRGVERLGAAVSEVQPVLGQILEAYQALRSQLHAAGAPAFRPAADNVRDRLGRLMPRDFLLSTPFEWLRHYPRYLQAMRLRVQKLGGGGVPRDAKIVQDLTPLDRAYDDLVARQEELGLNPARIAEFRWMLEEFRVQSFAQELRTAVPVSAKRLQELWQKIVAG
jgi:ATP-dependent helicase HrpA